MGIGIRRAVIALSLLAWAGGAAAASTTFNTFDGQAGRFGNDRVAAGAFADRFTIVLPRDGELTGTVVSKADDAASDLDFSRVRLTAADGLVLYFTPERTGVQEQRTFVPQKLGAGTYTLDVEGRSGGAARYDGSLSFEEAGSVPEPATWVMMLLGFGSLGFVVRRRHDGGGRIRFH